MLKEDLRDKILFIVHVLKLNVRFIQTSKRPGFIMQKLYLYALKIVREFLGNKAFLKGSVKD